MDRISNLPDEIVCHILSFLNTKEAALTSLLSKRWKNQFVLSPNLRFGVKDLASTYSFTEFMETVLAMTSDNSPIKNFSLETLKVIDPADIKLWICTLLSRGDLERLYLDIPNIGVPSLSLPLEVFTCRTLVTLKLMSFRVPMVPANASLPSLKTLLLHDIRFSNRGGCAFEKLLSACSVLEELEMDNVKTVDLKHCTVSSPTLKRLTLNLPSFRSLTFDTPSLAYLDYSSNSSQEDYPYVNLDSLVEAKLFIYWHVHPNSGPEDLIKGLRNVRILDLMIARTLEIFYTFREAIPVFKNLYHLTIAVPDNEYYRVLPLLKNAPNLVTLVIQSISNRCEKELESKSISESFSGACLLTCRVKVLEINMRDNIIEMGQWKNFLEKLSCLELVKISFWTRDVKQRLQFTKDLLKLPRSSKCKIQLKFRSS